MIKLYDAKMNDVTQLHAIYSQYAKQHRSITEEMTEKYQPQIALKRKLENRLLQSHYARYDPTNGRQIKNILREYASLRDRMNFEVQNTGNEQTTHDLRRRMRQRRQSEKQRFYRSAMDPTVRHQIESAILLKLHPDLSLQPSLEVMQVMNCMLCSLSLFHSVPMMEYPMRCGVT